MHQYELNLSPEQGSRYIKRFLDLAEARRQSDNFILNGLNCATTQFEVLDAVVGNPTRAKAPYDPAHALKALQKRKLVVREIQPMEKEPWAVELLKTIPRH